MDPLYWQFVVRCGRKRKYRRPKLADEAAQRASIKTGELIISYQCYECRQWHIGHADKSQILARTIPWRPDLRAVLEPNPRRTSRQRPAERNANHDLLETLPTRTRRQERPTAACSKRAAETAVVNPTKSTAGSPRSGRSIRCGLRNNSRSTSVCQSWTNARFLLLTVVSILIAVEWSVRR
jgi:hypothetical protein